MEFTPATLARMMENNTARERRRVVTFLREQEEIAYASDMALGHKLHEIIDRIQRNEHAGVRLAMATVPARTEAEIDEDEEVERVVFNEPALPERERSDEMEAADLVRDLAARGQLGKRY